MNTTANCAELEGRVVDGRFRLVRWLGGSRQSSVYLTEIEADRMRKAAIKLIAVGAPEAEVLLAGWKAAASLSHPHLAQVLHAGRCPMDNGEVAYSVMEFADEVLSEILPERPLTGDETRQMLGPVLDGLLYLHGRGLAHGRLKPSNILVVEDSLKLSPDCVPFSDRAKAQFDEPEVYVAPEMARGVISAASDVWSLGMTLVAALTQKAPVWDRASGSEPVVPAEVPEPFAEITRQCLRQDAAQRCTLGQIQTRLEPETAPPQPLTAQSRSTRWTSVLAAAAVVLVAVGGAAVWHLRQPPASVPTVEQDATPTPSAAAPTSEAAPIQAAAPAPVPATPPTTAPARAAELRPDAAPGVSGKDGVLKRVLPDVLEAAQASIDGKVVVKVRVNVDASGDVSDVSSELPQASKYFTRVALEAARGWKFTAAQAQGKPIPSVWTLRFVFRRSGIETSATQQTR